MPQGDRPAEDGQQATHLRHAAWSAHQHISDTLPGLHTNTSQTRCLVCTPTHLRHAAWSAHQHISDTLPGLHTNTSQTRCLVCTPTHLRHAAWSAHQHILGVCLTKMASVPPPKAMRTRAGAVTFFTTSVFASCSEHSSTPTITPQATL